jgi:hypothetical protein
MEAEEANHHQAEAEKIEGREPEMESQSAISGDEICATWNRKRKTTVTYQTVKVYITQLVQKSFRNGKDAMIH